MSNKYGAIRVEEDGYAFASKAENRRYRELKLMVMAGEIADLELQPRYPLAVNGVKVGTYVADYRYRDLRSGETIVEDVKGSATVTPIYRLKKKLVLAIHGVTISEVFV